MVGRYTGSITAGAYFYFACYHPTNDKVILAKVAPRGIDTASNRKQQVFTNLVTSPVVNAGKVGSEFTMKMSFDDDNIKVYVNGNPVIDVTDSTYTAGTAGVQVTRQGTAEVYDFKLSFPAAEQPGHECADSNNDHKCDDCGKVITVKGENAFVIVEGKKYEAANGVVEVKLPTKTGKISVVVGNAGTTAGSFSITIATPDDTNSDTGDNAAIVLFGSLLALSALAAGIMLTPDIRKKLLNR